MDFDDELAYRQASPCAAKFKHVAPEKVASIVAKCQEMIPWLCHFQSMYDAHSLPDKNQVDYAEEARRKDSIVRVANAIVSLSHPPLRSLQPAQTRPLASSMSADVAACISTGQGPAGQRLQRPACAHSSSCSSAVQQPPAKGRIQSAQ